MAELTGPNAHPPVDPVVHNEPPRARNPLFETYCALCCCIFFPCVIAGFVFTLLATRRVEAGFKDSFGSLIDSWKSDVVFGFTSNPSMVVANGLYLSPWAGKWPGTEPGCHCPTSTFFFSMRGVHPGLFARPCNWNETFSGCQSIPGNPDMTLNKWVHGEQWFAVKGHATSFLDLYDKMDADGKCVAGYKHCGDVKSKTKGFCIPIHFSECPITRISQSPEAGLTPITLGSTTLYVGRDNSANPFSDVGVSESHVCTSRGLYSITPGRKRYELLRGATEGCFKDNAAVYLSQIGEREYFDSNQVPYFRLVDYHVENSYRYFQFASRVLQWSAACNTLIPQVRHLSTDIIDVSTKSSTLSTVNIIALIILIPSMFCMFCAVVDTNPENGITFVSLGCSLLGYGLLLPYLIILYKKAHEFMNTFNQIQGQRCSDDNTNGVFELLGNSFRDEFVLKLKIALWLAGIGCVLQALFSAYVLRKKRQPANPQRGPEGAPLLGNNYNNPNRPGP